MSAVGGTMTLYVNGSAIESRSSTSNGTWNVGVGDVIYFELEATGCAQKANVYSTGIIADAGCTDTSVSITSQTYTVVSGDAGTTISLNMYSACDGGCL
jgi:hypothetical protein